MPNFITNRETKDLRSRLIELIQNSKELKFLVGFFYFSGINELYDAIKQNDKLTIKILVGLDVDKHIHQIIEYSSSLQNTSNKTITDNFLQSFKTAINSEELDLRESYEQVLFYLQLIKDGRLIIRKTREPNHAKLYIFALSKGLDIIRDTIFITGSSNLTRAGLTEQNELNVEISDYGTEEVKEYFEKLWRSAVKITEVDEVKKQIIRIIENESIFSEVSPYEAYVFTLKTFLDAQSAKEININSLCELMEKKGYIPYQYQLDAIKLAHTIIKEYNGVIIADVVGLGKTIIACAVAQLLRARGMVICPPGIMGDVDTKKYGWYKYLEDFGLRDWEILSSGRLETALERVRTAENFEVIIIDESHKYRNQDTSSYETLKNICLNKKVILLTATPFSNTPSDIFALLKLFTVPGKSKLTLYNDLDFKFREYRKVFAHLSDIRKNYNSGDPKKASRAQTLYQKYFGSSVINLIEVRERARYLADEIRSTIQPVLIRRNRLDLKADPDYQSEIQSLSRLEDPKELFFELTSEQSQFYDKVISEYFAVDGKFSGAIYRPYIYEEEVIEEVIEEEEEGDESQNNAESPKNKAKKEKQIERLSQKNLYDFMRRLLVKRFESSFGAFQKSVQNFRDIHTKVLKFIEKTGKYILDRKLLEKIYDSEPEEIEEELQKFANEIETLENKKSPFYKIYTIENFQFKDDFLRSICQDIKLFEDLLKEINLLDLTNNDPKAKETAKEIPELMENHEKTDPRRKIVIFTEYIDTANHLEQQLKTLLPREYKNRILKVIGKLSNERYDTLLKNFDASLDPCDQEDKYDILLTTDRLSEGFNLNRAGAVINYDIPWNPTRVIQRVGRINRISKKVFNSLYIYNFFPSEQGAELVRSREIAQQKMFLIHNALGEDSKIFEPDEEPTASKLYTKVMTNPDEMEPESAYTTIKKEFSKIKAKHPEVIERIAKLPPRIKSAKIYHENNLFVFVRKGRSIFVRVKNYDKQGPEDLPFEKAIEHIKCESHEKRVLFSNKFWDNYNEIRKNLETLSESEKENRTWQEAKNNIATILENLPEELNSYRPFLETLREDIINYRTLSDYTIRRIRNLQLDDNNQYKEFKKVVDNLRKDLGENYLKPIRESEQAIKPEVIIAIENIKSAYEQEMSQ